MHMGLVNKRIGLVWLRADGTTSNRKQERRDTSKLTLEHLKIRCRWLTRLDHDLKMSLGMWRTLALGDPVRQT